MDEPQGRALQQAPDKIQETPTPTTPYVRMGMFGGEGSRERHMATMRVQCVSDFEMIMRADEVLVRSW